MVDDQPTASLEFVLLTADTSNNQSVCDLCDAISAQIPKPSTAALVPGPPQIESHNQPPDTLR